MTILYSIHADPAEMAADEKPLVSIITPTKNRAALLKETIASVVAQTYSNWELIIVDDGSTDNTSEMLKEFSGDKRIRYVSRKGDRSGAQICRNQGIDESRGEYVMFLDSDDLLSKECVQNRINYFLNDPGLDFAVFPAIVFKDDINAKNVYWNFPNEHDEIYRFLNWDAVWGIVSVLWKKRKIAELGKFDANVLSFQDIDIHLRALIADFKFSYYKGGADAFVRDHPGERVGNYCEDDNHLHSHEALLNKIYKNLAEKNKLTDKRKKALAGFYFRVAEFWVKLGNISKASALWKHAAQTGLTSRSDYIKSSLFLYYLNLNKKEDIPVITRMGNWMRKKLPGEYFKKYNTWKRLPVSSFQFGV